MSGFHFEHKCTGINSLELSHKSVKINYKQLNGNHKDARPIDQKTVTIGFLADDADTDNVSLCDRPYKYSFLEILL